MFIEEFIKQAGGTIQKAQPRHDSGKFSAAPENASTKDEHEAAARYHDEKNTAKDSQAAAAHRTAAQLKEKNSPVSGIYSQSAREASAEANKN